MSEAADGASAGAERAGPAAAQDEAIGRIEVVPAVPAIPAGVMEADGETPWEACQREVLEECGLTVRSARLACVDFRRPRPGRTGGMRFLFDCGRMDDESVSAITVQEEEISEYRLVKLRTALPLLSGPIRRRVRAGSAATRTVYLEEGRPLDQVR